ncbi:DDRGK domain-containing protein 1-like [Mya arenaria]|uniref:DDRGK domain-containing protein 1-like n=1 Tax=Mya arenaria TaxID=6604 RepID=UPI0022E37368|nr:DDRGK domain-containing protein 1-like [Mya arenaria]
MAPVSQETVYLVLIAIIALVILLVYIFGGGDKKKGPEDGQAEAAAAGRPRAREGPPGARAGGMRRRNRRGRMQMADGDSDEEGGEMEEEDIFDEIGQTEGKIGAKKLRKLQEKAEKKRQREMELQEREEKRDREKKLEAQRKKEDEREKQEEEARLEDEKKAREEQEKRDHEEYLKLKEAFSVEEEGEAEEGANLDSQSLLQEFINYIKEMKVVMLEDLAAHFKIKTQDCINRIQDLQTDGRLTGVVDDRGKFIYITVEELEAVAKFIKQHGRVSIRELAESSSRLINLNPDNADIHKKLIVGDTDMREIVEVTE